VGFSYDTLANGTLDIFSTILLPVIAGFENEGVPEQNHTFFIVICPSLNSGSAGNATGNAAPALWSFLQTWFQEFASISLLIKYASLTLFQITLLQTFREQTQFLDRIIWRSLGPGLASYIKNQNEKITAGTLENAELIHIDTLGIINGMIDLSITAASYPDEAYNNTYGFQAISEADSNSATAHVTVCQALIEECRALTAISDPENGE
jgi:hypothetical protein